jgi:hypothetical protein
MKRRILHKNNRFQEEEENNRDLREKKLHLQHMGATRADRRQWPGYWRHNKSSSPPNARFGCPETEDPVSEPKPNIPVCYKVLRQKQGTAMVLHSERKNKMI